MARCSALRLVISTLVSDDVSVRLMCASLACLCWEGPIGWTEDREGAVELSDWLCEDRPADVAVLLVVLGMVDDLWSVS